MRVIRMGIWFFDALTSRQSKGIFGGNWVEQAVARIWELQTNKSDPEGFVKYISKYGHPPHGKTHSSTYHIFSGLVKLFPDLSFFDMENHLDSYLTPDKCIILCIVKGERWRKENKSAVRGILNANRLDWNFRSLLHSYPLPLREFFRTWLEFPFAVKPGGGVILFPKEVVKIISMLEEYLKDAMENGNLEEALRDTADFTEKYKVPQEEMKSSNLLLQWKQADIENVENAWKRVEEKIGILSAEKGEKNKGGYGEMVM